MKSLIMLIMTLTSSFVMAQDSFIRCNDDQTICEIKNRRITIGDKIGIFTSDGFVVAIGEVIKIVGTARTFKITHSYTRILRSHRAEIISDREAKTPEQYFKFLKTYADTMVGGKFGVYSMGIGDGFVANFIEAQYALEWEQLTYFAFKLNYLAGNGEASAKLQRVANTTVDLSVLGLSAGVAQVLFPNELFSFRLGLDLGLANATVKLGGDYDPASILNDRITEGMIFMARGEASIIYPWNSFFPMVNLEFLYLHSSFNTGISLGLLKAL